MENIDYVEAERHFHEALYQVDASEHATAQPFVEAKAVILDKVVITINNYNYNYYCFNNYF